MPALPSSPPSATSFLPSITLSHGNLPHLALQAGVIPNIEVAVPPAAKREVVKASFGRYISPRHRRPLGASPLRAVLYSAPPVVTEPSNVLKSPVPIIAIMPPSSEIDRIVPTGARPFNLSFDCVSESEYTQDNESFNLDDFPMPPTFIPAAVAHRAPALTDSRLKNAGRAARSPTPTKGCPSKRTIQNKENYTV